MSGRSARWPSLIHHYCQSARFRRLKPGSAKTYRTSFRAIEAWSGDAPARAITAADVETFYFAVHARTPSFANLSVTILAGIRRPLGVAARVFIGM